MIDDAIFAFITAAGTAAHAVIGTRLFPVDLPDDCPMPACTQQIVSNVPQHTLDDGVVSLTARIQIESWSPSKLEAAAADAAIAAMLDQYSGTMPGGTEVSNAWIQSGPLTGFNKDLRLYRVVTDYMLVYAPAD